MRLTKRCIDLLWLLRAARWLTTRQVHQRFFAHATRNAAQKRLRKLTRAGYLRMVQEHRMSQALFTLGPEGKRLLAMRGVNEIILERRPPKQLEHFLGVNDVRIAAELGAGLSYFFAFWELPCVGWRYPVIPDAVFCFDGRTYAVEFDRGPEGLQFFVKTKIGVYLRGFTGFPITALIIVTEAESRMKSLARTISNRGCPVLFTTLNLIRKQGISAPIFFQSPDGRPITLSAKSPHPVSSPEEAFGTATSTKQGGSSNLATAS